MPIRTYIFEQVSMMPVEGVGIHASFSISIVVRDERMKGGHRMYISLLMATAMRQKLLAQVNSYSGVL